MIFSPLPNAQSLMCIGCHADDIEIGCGGAILRWLQERPDTRVTWIVLSGDEERAAEARRSAEAFLGGLGNHRFIQKQFRDTYFPYERTGVKEFFRELAAEFDPDVIFTHCREDMHQDHRLVAELTWNTFRRHLIFEYEIPKYEGDLGHPNVFFPLDEATARKKVETTLASFPSQQARPWFQPETLWAMLRIRGVECAAPSGYAEGLHCRKLCY